MCFLSFFDCIRFLEQGMVEALVIAKDGAQQETVATRSSFTIGSRRVLKADGIALHTLSPQHASKFIS